MTAKKNESPNKTANKKSSQPSKKNNSMKPEIISIITIGVCILVIISVFSGNGEIPDAYSENAIGFLGGMICWFLKGLFGIGAYVLPFAVIGFCSSAFFSDTKKIKLSKLIMSVILFLILISFMHLVGPDSEKSAAECFSSGSPLNGGFIGCIAGNFLYGILGFGAYIVFIILAIILAVMITGKSFMSFLRSAYFRFKGLFEKDSFFDKDYDDYISEDDGKDFEDEKKNPKTESLQRKRRKMSYGGKSKTDSKKQVISKDGRILSVNIPEKKTNENKTKISLFTDELNINKNKGPEFLSAARNKRLKKQAAKQEKPKEPLPYENYNYEDDIIINGMVADNPYKTDVSENNFNYSPPLNDSVEGSPNYDYPSVKSKFSEKELDEMVIEDLKERCKERGKTPYVFGDIENIDDIKNRVFSEYMSDNPEDNNYNEEYNRETSESFNYESPNTFENQYSEEYPSKKAFEEDEEEDVSFDSEYIDEHIVEHFFDYENPEYFTNEYENDENLKKAMFDYFDGDMGVSVNVKEYLSDTGETDDTVYNNKADLYEKKSDNKKTDDIKEKRDIHPEKSEGIYKDMYKPSPSPKRETDYFHNDEPKILQAEKQILTEKNFAQDNVPKKEYVFPLLSFLEKNPVVPSQSSREEILENSRILIKTLKSFNIEAKVNEISKGPTVTRYELSPGEGIKVSKILGLADNLAMSLAAKSIRIEAPIPGKSAVGIEIPNKEVTSVYLSEVICDKNFQEFPSKLAFGLGKDITGNVIVADIAKMPHMLIAGRTGSGKSVCINTLITSIIYKSTPDEVKLIMVDPKVVELSVYNGIPHLLIPVVTDPQKAAGALNWAVAEMMSRYDLFAKTGSRNLKGYNGYLEENGMEKIPQIVIIIDELADLMMVASKEVEAAICRLAQLARAAGIHLIIATQRPSVDVITGLIKANIPSRIAFAVSSATDSRTILDMSGAEKLLGMGDMLFKSVSVDSDKPTRIQGAFISDKDVEKIVTFIKENNPVVYDESLIEKITSSSSSSEKGGNDDSDESDELIDEAIAFIVKKGSASGSMLQRKFKIGYNRAARIIEELEDRGIIGPETGTSKPRAVLMNRYEYEDYMERRRDYI